jgi:two-component system chemotaxis sensor kinase CheA
VALSEVFDAIAELTASIDVTDLPGLVDLQERLETAVDAADEAGRSRMASGCREAAQLAGAIIFRESDDTAGVFDRLRASVEAICEAARGDADLPAEVAERLIGAGSDGGSDGGTHLADDVDLELLGSWIGSTADHLGTIEAIAVELESPEDLEPERVAEARRIIHTLKGEAGFLSLDPVRDLCHEVESLMDRREASGTPHRADELLALVDWLKRVIDLLADDPRSALPPHADILASITDGERAATPATAAAPAAAAATADDPAFNDASPVTFSDDMGMDENLGEFIGESREHLAAAEESLLALEQDPENNELINTVFRAFHTVKGVAGFMNLGPIVEFAHEAETLLDHARNGKLRLDAVKLDLILRSCDHLAQLVATLEGSTPPTLGLHRRLIDALVRTVKGETVTLGGNTPASPASEVVADAAPATDAGSPAGRATSPTSGGGGTGGGGNAPAARGDAAGRRTKVEQTVKVNSSRLDGLVTMVGELVIAQQMVVQDPSVAEIVDPRVQRSLAQVSKIIRDLQGVSMALSMVPVRGTFQKMARLVRDVSAKAGKKITFEMEGEDTELDRNVVEEIGDPLVHMVRNACDHGVEKPEDRIAAGKPPQGKLTLRAYHQGGAIIIEIRDDGRGLNRDRILAKAVERGLISADRKLDDIPDSEVWNMIFLPGFSTAEKITDISGRGVGMDVVRKNIEALRGAVEIQSTPGEGSVFLMKLPLTMAIIDGMVVRVGSERFVIPTLAIEQSFRPTAEDLETTMQSGEMARIRGDLLPIHRLKRIFNLEDGHDDLTDGLLLVLESTEGRFCLAVDHILGQQQVVIKTLGSGVKPIRGVAGGAILGDGRVALILDITGIVGQAISDETAHGDTARAGVTGSTT